MSKVMNCGPHGIPSTIVLYSDGNKPQNTNCTYTGVPRKIQRYTHATDRSTGFGDSRITASTTPSTIAMAIASTVSSSVVIAPEMMRLSNRYCA